MNSGASGERCRGTAEGVFEGGRIVHIESDDGVGAHGFKQACDVTCCHRIAGLGAPIFARIAQIGREYGDARGATVLERGDEKQQLAQLVVCALLGFAVKALQHEHVRAAHSFERAYFMLAILEFPLLVRCQRAIKCSGDRRAELGGRVQRKEARRLLCHRSYCRSPLRRSAHLLERVQQCPPRVGSASALAQCGGWANEGPEKPGGPLSLRFGPM